MSVNGKPNEGDVYLEDDGYMLCYLKNSNSCWYKLYLSPEAKGSNLWLSEPSPSIFSNKGVFVMNIKDLLLTVRKELKDEPSR
jgi:hypothetical protein